MNHFETSNQLLRSTDAMQRDHRKVSNMVTAYGKLINIYQRIPFAVRSIKFTTGLKNVTFIVVKLKNLIVFDSVKK